MSSLVAIVSGCTADKTICPESIINTALVLLPQVASIATFVSFASCIILFIGAASGLTIETILFAETTFPNPMLTKEENANCGYRF